MSASQSFLSSPDYGYDYVVAVTQDSINATATAFLTTRQPVVSACYVADDNGDPKYIDYETLKKNAKGTDPFKITEKTPDRETLVQNLDDAGFMFGFQAAMGLPAGFDARTLPDIITLGPTAADRVIYRLLCKSFLLVELNQISHKKPVFRTVAQPKGPDDVPKGDPKGEPWIFTYKVPLLSQPADTKAFIKTPAFGKLPAGVQQKLTAKPEDFTIQSLLFDFGNAASEVRPEISGVKPELREKLYSDFAIKYFTEMQAAGAPVLAVTPNDPLANLKTEFSVNACPAQPKLATLNYLCATAEHKLPAAKSFPWNWIEPAEAKEIQDLDGVVVINRSCLAQQLQSQLAPYVDSNCWIPHPMVEFVTLSEEMVGFMIQDRTFNNWGPKGRPQALTETFNCETPTQGPLLLHWHFTASREDDESYFQHGGGDSWMKVSTLFDLQVACEGNTITIVQHVFVNYYLKIQTLSENTNMADMTITDTFTLGAAGDKVTWPCSSKKEDKSGDPQYWISCPKLQSQMRDTKAKALSRISSRFIDIPLSGMRDVIFPGGKAFFFKDVRFSDHQDLFAHSTYRDPV